MPDRAVSRGWQDACACLLVAGLTLGVFAQTRSFGFIQYDDGPMVYQNPHVLGGLTWENFWWAVTHGLAGIWMPLTVLTYLADFECYGLWPGGYHLTSMAIHACNGVLLYGALRVMTGRAGRSLLVAALFAIHPLRANSVVWIASRKDVTSGLFWIAAMLAYWYYVQRPGWRRYLPVFGAMVLGVTSKAMIVTLPCTLLLLDWWPLQRWGVSGTPLWRQKRKAAQLVLEKLPLFMLSAAGSWAVVRTQATAQAYVSLEQSPLGARLANAAVAYVRYLAHLFCPVRLSAFYPHPPEGQPLGQAVAAACLLLLITAVVLWASQKRYLAMGWFWFLGTLVPVIGVVQLGSASMADRYTYIPTIGIIVAVVWAVADLAAERVGRRGQRLLWAGAGVVLALLTALGWWQAGHWRDTETLFQRALAVNPDNDFAHTKLGDVFFAAGRQEEALFHFQQALRIAPGNPEWHYNLGSALLEPGGYSVALVRLARAVELRPAYAEAQTNLGVAYLGLGQTALALPHLAEGVRLKPDDVNAQINYGVGLLRRGDKAGAERAFLAALAFEPANEAARSNLALVRGAQGSHEGKSTTEPAPGVAP